jgi:UDP-galactopyranose mutase
VPAPADHAYDVIVVGAGMYGSCFARLATDRGLKVLVLERRPHIAGNCYTETLEGIHVHRYGPHIFHTSNSAVWEFLNRFAEFNNYINTPLAISRGELFSLPFNMYTFHQLWGVRTPAEARAKLAEQCVRYDQPPANLEEQALSLVGPDLYERLIRGYTQRKILVTFRRILFAACHFASPITVTTSTIATKASRQAATRSCSATC